jgi:hypothetical protein
MAVLAAMAVTAALAALAETPLVAPTAMAETVATPALQAMGPVAQLVAVTVAVEETGALAA